MKKILGVFLTFILLCWGSVVLANERVVQLNVPGCSA